MRFKVTIAQRRYNAPDDTTRDLTITAHGSSPARTYYLTEPTLGCSRDYRLTPDAAIRRWLETEWAQTVLAIEPIE